jgi:hypothetical protein
VKKPYWFPEIDGPSAQTNPPSGGLDQVMVGQGHYKNRTKAAKLTKQAEKVRFTAISLAPGGY